MTAAQFVGLRFTCGLAAMLIAALVILASPAQFKMPFAAVGVALAVTGFFGPMILLKRYASARVSEMRLALPEVLDLIVLSVEAGVGFDNAEQLAIEGLDNPLAVELRHVISAIEHGKRRGEAFGDLANRTRIEGLSMLAGTIHQAEQMGGSVGDTLRELSDQLRNERSQRAKELIATLPTKLLFPLVFFVLPALFIVILGPMAVVLREMMKSGLLPV